MTYQQPQDQYPSQGQPEFVRARRSRLIMPFVIVLAALVVGVSVVAVVFLVRGGSGASNGNGASIGDGAPNSVLADVQERCGLSRAYAVIGDNGQTLTLKGQGDEESGLSWSEIECALDGTEMPASVRGQFNQTRALDGMQSASWQEYSATWNYHPDSGVNLVITVK